VARVLEEMNPSYSYAEFKSQSKLIVRPLPGSANELNSLILDNVPGAELDKTMLQPFTDKDGGKGMRVSFFKAIAAEPGPPERIKRGFAGSGQKGIPNSAGACRSKARADSNESIVHRPRTHLGVLFVFPAGIRPE